MSNFPGVPERWGNGCDCWVTPESQWFTYGSAVEPGSQVEFNPTCPKHGTHTHDGIKRDKAIHPGDDLGGKREWVK